MKFPRTLEEAKQLQAARTALTEPAAFYREEPAMLRAVPWKRDNAPLYRAGAIGIMVIVSLLAIWLRFL